MLCARDFADVVNQLRKENMKKNNRAKLLFAFLGIATFASLVGTVSGSLAWYAYSSRATLSYSGTSVNNTVQLQIGIASPNEVLTLDQIREELANNDKLDDAEKQRIEASFVEFWDTAELNTWDGDSNYYYFAPVGTGLSSEFISAYLKSSGYGTNSLIPVTTGAYSRGDAFKLKKAPTDVNPRIETPAGKECYATIPFVFRVIRSNTTTTNNFVEGSELWLTDAKVRASSSEDGEAYKAVRMFIDRDSSYEDDFIVNPSVTAKGGTVVAGILDINGDNYYDYDNEGNEYVYGDYESVGGIKTAYAGPDEFADINGTGRVGEERKDRDSFTGKHRPGVNYFENYDECVFKKAEYESLGSIAPAKDEVTGKLFNKDVNHPTSLCVTAGAAGHYLGQVDFTIYLEGWDQSVIDAEIAHYFDLGLTFEINKL